MQRTMDDRYKDFQAKMAGNERAQRELQRVLDNSDKMPEQQSAAELLPVEEMEERLQYINVVEKHWHDNFAYLSQKPGEAYRSFNDAELSALLHMDTGYLCNELMQWTSIESLIQSILGIPATLKFFATKALSAEALQRISKKIPPLRPPSVSSASGDDDDEKEATEKRRSTKLDSSGKAQRNNYYAEKRRHLDGHRCVLTGTRDAQVCHIVPFAANATKDGMDRWHKVIQASMRLFLQERPGVDLYAEARLHSLFGFEQGVSDRHWNTISLTPTMHDWWGRGYFGLKYIGTNDANVQDPNAVVTLRIQFHWMPWRCRKLGQKPAPLGRTKEDILAAISTSCGQPSSWQGEPMVAMSRPETGFNLETGDVFGIHIPRRHMEKMVEAFRMQWALIKLLAMAGGAEVVADYPDDPEFLDENWELPGRKALRLAYIDIRAAVAEEE
ncbi:hypothetical protein B0T16DRAFT_72009 [Cercophora newfieldiana]|uniref:HNH nuclease domain-containing protein n=1 Tax=Cercophora newfieldiana TaxID=92897 RepID=A0AA39YU89_9PEZI|nr:hypothetical protein B0T16DRAFT_72009 [Cercophora newfieldiana]